MEYLPLTFTGGLVTQLDESIVPDGAATIQTNWEPVPTQGLRARRGWIQSGTSGQPATQRGRGMDASYVTGNVRKFALVSTNGAATTMSVYYQNYTDQLLSSWNLIESLSVGSTSPLPVAMASGAGYLLYSHPDFPNTGRIRKWNGTTASDAETTGLGGRALVYHLSRFFAGGGKTNPTYLRWSEVADPATWTVADNYIPVQENDGEPIEDLAIFDRGLVIAKENSLHFLSGLTPDAFIIQPIHNQIGGAVGKCLAVSSEGVFIVSKHAVYFWNGGTFDRISRWIDFIITGNFVTTAIVEDMLWIVDSAGATWVYDIAEGRWWKEAASVSPTANDIGYIYAYGRNLYGLPVNANGGSIIRSRNTVIGGREADEFYGGVYTLQTEQKWLPGPFGSKTAVRHVYLRYRVRGTLGEPDTFTITLTAEDGTFKVVDIAPEQDEGVYQRRFDTSLVCKALTVRLDADISPGASIDVEEIALGVLPEASKR